MYIHCGRAFSNASYFTIVLLVDTRGFSYSMIGYVGADAYFHSEVDCHVSYGHAQRIPETKALKWGKSHCPVCFDPDV